MVWVIFKDILPKYVWGVTTLEIDGPQGPKCRCSWSELGLQVFSPHTHLASCISSGIMVTLLM